MASWLNILFIVLALTGSGWAQAGVPGAVGFINGAAARGALLGLWINSYLTDPEAGPVRRLWQTFEIFDEGVSVHAYYFSDPLEGDEEPFSRVVAIWEAGVFNDPEPAKGSFEVIRFTPQVYSNLIPGTMRYRHLRGSFAPQFRRFFFAPDADRLNPDRLTMSELVVLEFPVDQVRSFPDEAIFTEYRRVQAVPSAVEAVSWGKLKNGGLLR